MVSRQRAERRAFGSRIHCSESVADLVDADAEA
jgi:hypothetical protein